MEFISEKTIEKVVEKLEASEAFEGEIAQLQQQQPLLFVHLVSENFQVFTQQEREYLLYLLLVIWKAVISVRGVLPAVTENALAEAEEHNWGLMQEVPLGQFRDRLDIFFENYPQEDLLAYVEDALTDDEDMLVTHEAREALFISLKSFIDVLTG